MATAGASVVVSFVVVVLVEVCFGYVLVSLAAVAVVATRGVGFGPAVGGVVAEIVVTVSSSWCWCYALAAVVEAVAVIEASVVVLWLV